MEAQTYVYANDDEQELDEYLRQLKAYRSLKLNEERGLVAQLADPESDQQGIRKQLIEGYLPLVVQQARRYQHLGVPLSELIAQGNLALVQAASFFVPAPNYLFRHYARRGIRQALYRLTVENTHGLHMSSWATEALYQLNHRTFHRFQYIGVDLLDEQMRVEVGLSEEQIGELARQLEPPLSLDAPLEYDPENDAEPLDDSSYTLLEVIAASRTFVYEEEDDLRVQRMLLQQGLAQLPPRHRRALELRYGLGEDGYEHSFKDVGHLLGVTRERARQLIERGKRALRHFFLHGTTDFKQLTAARHSSQRTQQNTGRPEPPRRDRKRTVASTLRPARSKQERSMQLSPQEQRTRKAVAHPPWTGGASSDQLGFTDRSLNSAGTDAQPRKILLRQSSSYGKQLHSGWISELLIGPMGQGRSFLAHLLAEELASLEQQPDQTSDKPVEGQITASPINLSNTFENAHYGPTHPFPSVPPLLIHSCHIRTLAWSPVGTRLALVDGEGQLSVYDLASGKVIQRFHQATPVLPLCWSPDGKRIASATLERGIWIQDVATGSVCLYDTGHQNPIRVLAWSPDGRQLASADSSAIHILETASPGAEARILLKTLHRSVPAKLAWSPDAARLAIVIRPNWRVPLFSPSDSVQIWDVLSSQAQLTRYSPTKIITDIAWSEDGSRIALAGKGVPMVHILAIPTGHPVVSGKASAKGSSWIHWGRGEEALAILSSHGTVYLLHAATGECLAQLRISSEAIACAAWSPDGHVLAFTETGSCTVFFWRWP